MPKFTVMVSEHNSRTYVVEAKSAAEVRRRFFNGDAALSESATEVRTDMTDCEIVEVELSTPADIRAFEFEVQRRDRPDALFANSGLYEAEQLKAALTAAKSYKAEAAELKAKIDQMAPEMGWGTPRRSPH